VIRLRRPPGSPLTVGLGDRVKGCMAIADRDLVIEAATENPQVKKALFAEIDTVVKGPTRSSRPTPPRSRSSR